MSFPHSVRGKVPFVDKLHIGLITDVDEEDLDDWCAILKITAVMRLIHKDNPSTHLTVHLALDCDDRIKYLKCLMQAFSRCSKDTLCIHDANLEFVIYKFEVTSAERLKEVDRRMHKALQKDVHGTNAVVQIEESRNAREFPWPFLDVLIVAGPLHGINTTNIKHMPIYSVVAQVGDKKSVNAQPNEEFMKMQSSCKLKSSGNGDVRIESRYWEFPPVDPNGEDGVTRQSLISIAYMEIFCVLHEKTKQHTFQMMIEGLANATRRTFTDRPDNRRGKHVRNRIDVSNKKTVEAMMLDIQPSSSITITKLNTKTQVQVVEKIGPVGNMYNAILKMADKLLTDLPESNVVLVRSSVSLSPAMGNVTLNLSALFQSYCRQFQIDESDPLMQHSPYTEKIAILTCVLSSMAVFGNIFAPSPEIATDPQFLDLVKSEIIQGFPKCKPQGELKFLTPNYDGVVCEAVLLHVLQVVPLQKLKHVVVPGYDAQPDAQPGTVASMAAGGHVVVCKQDEQEIDAYKSREKEQLDEIVLSQRNVFRRTESVIDAVMLPVESKELEEDVMARPFTDKNIREVCAAVCAPMATVIATAYAETPTPSVSRASSDLHMEVAT